MHRMPSGGCIARLVMRASSTPCRTTAGAAAHRSRSISTTAKLDRTSCSKVVSPIYGNIERSIPSLPISMGSSSAWARLVEAISKDRTTPLGSTGRAPRRSCSSSYPYRRSAWTENSRKSTYRMLHSLPYGSGGWPISPPWSLLPSTRNGSSECLYTAVRGRNLLRRRQYCHEAIHEWQGVGQKKCRPDHGERTPPRKTVLGFVGASIHRFPP
jgi:hypothetical protein